jgi:hypothetical protein
MVPATGRFLIQRSLAECVCVCVSLSVVRRNINPLYLKQVSRRGQGKKEIKKTCIFLRAMQKKISVSLSFES